MKIFHIHQYKPIVSRYISFGARDIIYECRCGKREVRRVRRNFGDEFPIITATLLSKDDFDAILGGEDYEYVNEHIVFLKKDLVVRN